MTTMRSGRRKVRGVRSRRASRSQGNDAQEEMRRVHVFGTSFTGIDVEIEYEEVSIYQDHYGNYAVEILNLVTGELYKRRESKEKVQKTYYLT
jgi:hypothetical protein